MIHYYALHRVRSKRLGPNLPVDVQLHDALLKGDTCLVSFLLQFSIPLAMFHHREHEPMNSHYCALHRVRSKRLGPIQQAAYQVHDM